MYQFKLNMNTKLELSLFVFLNLLHYAMINNLDFEVLKHYITVIFLFITINFLVGRNDIKNHKMLYLDNVILYNKLNQLEEKLKNISTQKEEEIFQLKNKFLGILKNYQKKIKRCLAPFCENVSLGICVEHQKFKEKNCPICYDQFDITQTPLKCGHFIHQECISSLKSCPICRSTDLDYLS